MPALLLHLWCYGRHTWIPCTFLQTSYWTFPAPSFCKWFDMAYIVKGWFSIHQRMPHDLLSDNKRPRWTHSHSMASWSLRYLGRHSYWRCGPLLPEYVIRLCSLSSWSGGHQTQRREINWNCMQSSFSFPSPLRRSVLLTRSVRTSFLHWAIESLFTLTTNERHFSFFNAFPLRSSALMQSVSTIHSAILRWKCDVTSRHTPSSCFFSHS